MASVPADDYIERLSRYIQSNSSRLAAPPLRRPPSSSALWPGSTPAKPLSLRITPHNLYYLLLRFEAIGLDVGPLDVRLGDDARRAISFVEPRRTQGGSGRSRDWSETGSFRSMTSAVSSLSLGGWWATSKVVDPDATLKLIYSSFTKLPSLVVHAAGLGDDTIQEMESTGPLDCCVPLRIFRNLQLLEIHSLPPAALLVPSSPVLRSVILCDLDSPTCDEEAAWLVPALFAKPSQMASAVCNGTPRGRVVRTRQPSATTDVMAGMDEEDEETSDSDSFQPPPLSSSALPAAAANLPTLARFVNLSHLALPHLSLVTLPRLPLPSVVSLDLSHNLLLELPANLVLLPNLISLNLEGNMIQSLRGADQVLPAPSLASSAAAVRGTPSKRLRTATGLRVLNLDQNRIANLHGLAALSTLKRLSIRDNRLSESQELHRLTVLPVLNDLYVCPQPFSALPAEEGWRVRLWEAFAREGRAELDCAKIDGEGVGWSERRKMRVSFPAVSHAAGSSSNGRPVSKPRSPDVVAVGARRALSPARSATDKQPLQLDVFASTPVASSQAGARSPQPSSFPAGLAPPKTGMTPSLTPKRRKQRIVNLDGSVEAMQRGGPVSGDDSDVSAVVKRSPRSPAKPTASGSGRPSSPATLRVPTAHSSLKLPSPSKSSHARRALSSSVYDPAGQGPSSPPGSSAAESGDEFRRKLEGLRSDVGDSWLRVLSAGGTGNAGGSGSESPGHGQDEPEDDEPTVEQEAPVEEAPAPVPTLDEPEDVVVADAPEVVQVVKKPAKKKKAKGNGKKKS